MKLSRPRFHAIAARDLLAAICLTLLAACGADGITDTGMAPQAPADLVDADAASTEGRVSLSWSESNGAQSYQVKRATTSGGPYTPIAVSTSTTFTDTSLSDGTTYHYVVSAANTVGESVNSVQMSAMSRAATAPPPAPGNPAATAGDAQISLAWGASKGATSYRVMRSDDSGGSYHQVGLPTSPSFTNTGLVNGRPYFYVVRAVNSAGDSGNSGLTGATPQASTATPATPGNVAASAGNAQVSLSWSASSGATSYNIKRSGASGGPYAQMATRSSPGYTDSSLSNGTTYYYVVTAVNSSGESANSAQVSATPVATATVPSPPSNLAAAAGNAQVSLSWSASSGATSYNVKRSADGGGSYQQVAMRTTTSYVDTGLTNGTTYYYVVTAVNSAGESGNSGVVGGTPQGSISPPAAPTNVMATGGNAQVSLSWVATNGATSYNVKRSTANGGPYSQVAARTTTSYTDSSLANGTTYYYVVTAVNSAGESGNSAQVGATPGAATTAPQPPANLTATAGSAQVSLSWSASSGATSYNVKRSDDSGGSYHQVGTPTTSSYVDTTVTNGRPYFYVVTAVNSAGESGNSGLAGATPQGSATAPAAPSNVMATAGNAQVSVSWVASSGATSYRVKRSTTSGGPYTQVATPTSTSYTDSSLANGTTYFYVVTAINSAGESGNSAQVNATPTAPAVPPSAPGNVQATAGNAQVSISWSGSSGATGYRVKRSTTNGGPYTQVAAPGSTSYADSSLANGTTYFYVVTAINSAGESGNSAQVSATPTGGSTVSYSTSFDANESPLSEGGRWKHTNPWFTQVVTSGSYAYGTAPNPARQGLYEDSYAYLGGMGFPSNQSASAHIHKGAANGYLEVELLLRWSDTGNSTQGYECYLHRSGEYVTIARWTGRAMNSPADLSYFDEITRSTGTLSPNDGDLFEASIIGNTITVKLRGVTILTGDVSSGGRTPIAAGDPGIGFDSGATGAETPNSTFGLTDFSATGL